MTVNFDNWRKWLDSWKGQLTALQKREGDEDEYDEEEERKHEKVVRLLKRSCELIRRAEGLNRPDFKEMVNAVAEFQAFGVAAAYEGHWCQFLPSYAHSSVSPLVNDGNNRGLGAGTLGMVFNFMTSIMGPGFGDTASSSLSRMAATLGPWDQSPHPHAKTTPLSRFREPLLIFPTRDLPTARNIYEARCEVQCHSICSPATMAISSDNSCLAIASAGGYKNRDPKLHFYILDSNAGEDDDDEHGFTITPGLLSIGNRLTLDAGRKLIFVADNDRVKSYSWEKKGAEGLRGAPVHTLCSGMHRGPLAIHSTNRILRAGKGSVLAWNIDELETHGPNNQRIGLGKVDISNTWRDLDDDDDVEPSTGSLPHTTIELAELDIRIDEWELHKPSGQFIYAAGAGNGSSFGSNHGYGFGCGSIDLEKGVTVTRYLGHGGSVTHISTSDGDPNIFATTAGDGYARLFDVRKHLPVVTFNVEAESSTCHAGTLAHPDGVPVLFTGGNKSEQVIMWDIRSREAVYDLSTGNTAVSSIAWDSSRSTLFAATECMNVDRFGGTHFYRRARIPKFLRKRDQTQMTEENDGKLDAVDDDDDNDRNWPERAFHSESHYGHLFDAADHSLFRYRFKDDPNTDALPVSGWSSTGGFDDLW